MDSEQSGLVLLVDDDPAVGKVLGALLGQAGIRSQHVGSGEEALSALAARPFDVVVTDLRMPEMDGLELLGKVGERWPEVPVVVLTAHGTVPDAVEAMKRGAADFMTKPFDREEILFVIRKALASTRNPVPAGLPATSFVGDSSAMKEIHTLIRRAAASNATVLIQGESGTGKELAARAIHEQSPRRAGPLVKLHCAALPEALLESELFGYEKGAFTGAASRKPGRVELAQGGTLFLDEIGEVPLSIQVKLLRVLQEREFERLGGTQTLKADIRFVAATHRNLEQMVKAGQFREDLFYRLNVVPLWLPPLRARPEDVDPLARHFCATQAAANGKPGMGFEPAALAALRAQPWPGNVRQLQNFVERLVVFSDGRSITLADVRRELDRGSGLPPPASEDGTTSASGTLEDRRRATEKEALLGALRRSGENRSQAARLLGVSRRTLYNKLVEHGLA